MMFLRLLPVNLKSFSKTAVVSFSSRGLIFWDIEGMGFESRVLVAAATFLFSASRVLQFFFFIILTPSL